MRTRACMFVCACVCVRARVYARVSACVCVCAHGENADCCELHELYSIAEVSAAFEKHSDILCVFEAMQRNMHNLSILEAGLDFLGSVQTYWFNAHDQRWAGSVDLMLDILESHGHVQGAVQFLSYDFGSCSLVNATSGIGDW